MQYALTRQEAVYQRELEQEILSVIDRKSDEFASIAQNVITSAAKKMAGGSNVGTAIAVADVGASVAKGVSEIHELKSYLLSGIHEKSARVASNLPSLEGLLESSIHGINGSKAHIVRTVLESRGVISGSGNVTHLQVDLDKFGFVPGLSVSRRSEERQDVSHTALFNSNSGTPNGHPGHSNCHPGLDPGSQATNTSIANGRASEPNATSTSVTSRSVVRADEKDIHVTPFIFEELSTTSQRTTSVSEASLIPESGTGANTTEFGAAEKHRGQIYEVLSKVDAVNRADHNYDAQIDHMASHISDIVGDRMRGMMSSGIIRPITAPIVQKTADTMVKWSADWIKSYAEKVSTEVDNRRSEFGDATTGVAASSDDASVLDKVEGKLVELGADVYDAVTGKGGSDGGTKPQGEAEDDTVYMDEVGPEGNFNARDEREEIEEGGDYSSNTQAGLRPPYVVDPDNVISIRPQKTDHIDSDVGRTNSAILAPVDAPLEVTGDIARNLRNAAGVVGTVVRRNPSAFVAAAATQGLHNAAQFESSHPWTSSEFDDILLNQNIPDSYKDAMWQQMQTDPLFRRQTAESQLSGTSNLIRKDGQLFVSNEYLEKQGFDAGNLPSVSANPGSLVPSALITPVTELKPLELITPDQSAELRRLTTTTGTQEIDPRKALLPLATDTVFEKKKAGGRNSQQTGAQKTSGFKDSVISPSPMPDPDDDKFAQKLGDKKRLKTNSVKSRIKDQKLPTEGKIRFIPKKGYKPSRPLDKGPNNGFIDKFGNEWRKGPSRTKGEPFEWDVQLSSQGKQRLGWASRDGKHVNISLKGKITH